MTVEFTNKEDKICTVKKVLFTEKRANLIAEIGKGESDLGLSSHLAVVSVGDDDLW